MLTHSSILVWKIARIEKPGRLHFIALKGHTQTRRKHESQMFHFPIGMEKTLASSLDRKEIQPINPKGNQF